MKISKERCCAAVCLLDVSSCCTLGCSISPPYERVYRNLGLLLAINVRGDVADAAVGLAVGNNLAVGNTGGVD